MNVYDSIDQQYKALKISEDVDLNTVTLQYMTNLITLDVKSCVILKVIFQTDYFNPADADENSRAYCVKENGNLVMYNPESYSPNTALFNFLEFCKFIEQLEDHIHTVRIQYGLPGLLAENNKRFKIIERKKQATQIEEKHYNVVGPIKRMQSAVRVYTGTKDDFKAKTITKDKDNITTKVISSAIANRVVTTFKLKKV